jgi:RNase P protein component
MKNYKWLNLQLFAGEGAGNGGGEGAASGESAVDAGQQRLRELGVPEDKIRKRANRAAAKLPAGAVRTAPPEPQQTQEPAAAADPNPTEEKKTETPARMSWEDIVADPEYNKQIQAVVQSRLRGAKASEEAMGKLAPALELLARKHGMDPAKPDYEALAKAISDDRSYYEDKALEMGVPVEDAMKLDQEERETARRQRQEQQTIEQQKIQRHFQSLQQQGEAMKSKFPGFDLQKELQNPAFFRMTSPNVGISVEDAYFAVHRNEIMSAGMQVTAQKTAQKISNSIQAGRSRPSEAGTSGQAPSVTTFDYSKASPEQRNELKRQIRAAAARGEKLYPGR